MDFCRTDMAKMLAVEAIIETDGFVNINLIATSFYYRWQWKINPKVFMEISDLNYNLGDQITWLRNIIRVCILCAEFYIIHAMELLP